MLYAFSWLFGLGGPLTLLAWARIHHGQAGWTVPLCISGVCFIGSISCAILEGLAGPHTRRPAPEYETWVLIGYEVQDAPDFGDNYCQYPEPLGSARRDCIAPFKGAPN